MKSLLFFTAAALLLVESAVAYAAPENLSDRDSTPKWAGSERANNWGILLQPQVAVCHKIKERVGTRNGKAVYRTHCA